MATYEATIPTVPYGNVRISADTFKEFIEAYADAADFAATQTEQAAVETLQNGGLLPSSPNLGSDAPANATPSQPAQQQGQRQDKWGNPIVGQLNGKDIVYKDGQYGPYVQAGWGDSVRRGSGPRGWDKTTPPSEAIAIKWIEASEEAKRQKARG